MSRGSEIEYRGSDGIWSDQKGIDYGQGIEIMIEHIWEEQGTYTIACKARDSVGSESDWAYLEVTMPVNQQTYSYGFTLIQKILDRFPNAFPILRQILGLIN